MPEISPKQRKKLEKMSTLSDADFSNEALVIVNELSSIQDTLEIIAEQKEVEFPEIQKVEVLNFPEEKETVVNVEAPIVNIPAPVVNVPAPIVNVQASEVTIDTATLVEGLDSVNDSIQDVLNEAKKDKIHRVRLVDKDGKDAKLGGDVYGGGGKTQILASGGNTEMTEKITKAIGYSDPTLGGAGVNGTRDLTSANTWYAVPSTIPTSTYVLTATIENSVGTIRWGFDNTGTPSAINGNLAPGELVVRLASGQVIYYTSSTAGDDINWTTKLV